MRNSKSAPTSIFKAYLVGRKNGRKERNEEIRENVLYPLIGRRKEKRKIGNGLVRDFKSLNIPQF